MFTDNLMVRHCDLSWNQIEINVLLMYEKLLNLGFINRNSQILIEPEAYEGKDEVLRFVT